MTQICCRHCFSILDLPSGHGAKAFECQICGNDATSKPIGQRDTSVGAGNTIVNGPAMHAAPAKNKVRGKVKCPHCKSVLKVTAVVGCNVQCPLCTVWFKFQPEAAVCG